MLQNARDLFGELRGFPSAAASVAAEYARSKFFGNGHHRPNFAVHIHGGTGAGPGLYHPWKNFLLSHLDNPPEVYLPRRVIVRASHLPNYIDLVPNNPDTLEIHLGHSVGGLICLMRLVTRPECIARVILVGTPVRPEYIHPWATKYVVRSVLRINAEALPDYLESLKVILSHPDLLAKITVISSPGDKFFPPKACVIKGAEYVKLQNCSHVGFIYREEALQAIGAIVARTIGPYVPKRKAA